MIPHSRPTLDAQDEAAMLSVIRSGHIAQGKEVTCLEDELARFIGVKHAVAVSSGTAALHLGLLALGIGSGDEVIIPTFVCTALLNAIRYVGGTPVLADIGEADFNIDPQDVKRKCSAKTRAIIVPHMFGLPADIDHLVSIGVPMIEDCAHALGSTYRGRKVGSFGRLAIFSFYATKMVTTGEGGMVATDDDLLAARVRNLRDYDEKPDDRVRFNYKLTDIQAALGRSQLGKIDSFIHRRREIAARYTGYLSSLCASVPHVPEGRTHVYFRYCISCRDVEASLTFTARMGITCRRPVFRPLHHYVGQRDNPVADKIWRDTLSIPIYPTLRENEVSRICSALDRLHRNGWI